MSGYKVDSTGSHIFRTINFGTNWTSIKGNLPDAPINDVIIDPANTNSLFIGTDVNVMYTNNLGTNWYVLGTGIPSNVPCQDLTFHNPSRALVVWTHGRSAFKTIVPITGIQNNVSQAPADFKLEQNYPNPFNPVTHLGFGISDLGFVSLKVYDVLGNRIVTLVNEKKSPGTYSVKWNAIDFSSGFYFYSLIIDGKIMQTRKMLLVK